MSTVAVAGLPAGARRWNAAAAVAPASIIVTIGIVLPVVILFRYSLNQFTPVKGMVDAFTAENYVKFVTDPFYLAVLWRTIRVAAICTAICVVLAFPMAYCLARTRSRFKNLLLMAVILPLFVGNAVRAAGWMVLFGNKGFVNSMLLGAGIVREPLQIMYTEFAVIVGVIAVNLPFVVLTLQAVLEGIDRAIEEAALGLGANPWRTFRHVVLPLAMPGVIAGTILSFILAMNAYATPVLLGGPTFQMMGPTVYNQFAGLSNWPFGAAMAFVLMTATLVLTLTSNWLAQARYRRATAAAVAA
ncbi:MAG TPA: ABC transporter permease [Casimicrobiaceae bacterium]|jgi:putative spermidine/putrescine transport system permease protein|nr:ABC transporter permease [Casimicrobiaceae bacterium]